MPAQRWVFDTTHSSIIFTVRYIVSRIPGCFTQWSGWLELEEDDIGSARVEALIDVASVDTRDVRRDAHLRSADFFDVANHPTMAFRSTRIERRGASTFRLAGELTIRGITREIVLDVETSGRAKDPWGKQRLGFRTRTSLDRKAFGVAFNQPLDTGGVMLGDTVDVEIDLQAVLAE